MLYGRERQERHFSGHTSPLGSDDRFVVFRGVSQTIKHVLLEAPFLGQ